MWPYVISTASIITFIIYIYIYIYINICVDPEQTRRDDANPSEDLNDAKPETI